MHDVVLDPADLKRAQLPISRGVIGQKGSTDGRWTVSGGPERRVTVLDARLETVVAIRPAVADDADEVARIYVESWNAGFGNVLGFRDLTPEQVARWRRDLAKASVDWAVAEVSEVVIGIVGVGPSRDPVDPRLGELDTIAVDPTHWRVGVGGCLMTHALGVLQRSWSRAILWTPANYERGHSFYRAMGWVPLDRSRREDREVAFGRRL